MNDGTEDQVKVSFPANPTFSRIGRVAVAGLALRLGIDIADVERLRLAVDRAVSALHGSGRIYLEAHWAPHELTINIENPTLSLDEAASTEVVMALAKMVDEVAVGRSSINLTLSDGRARGSDAVELV